ncbi:hypothetical protein [Candidatus Electronema sp. JC]|uniref:hypothetical protein n=1 Tax=Candidatus Electronema sp. JC TaxID=3401570 RepID=UPI003B42BD06
MGVMVHETHAAHAQQKWASCAQEGNVCVVPPPLRGKLISLRYGAEGKYSFKFFKGRDSWPCNNDVNGDPAPGKKKSCQIMTGNLKSIEDLPDSSWQFVANANKYVPKHTPENQLRWIRYGAGTKWTYDIIDGSGVQKCSTAALSEVDPAPGVTKKCYLGPKLDQVKYVAGELEYCASQFSSCYDLATSSSMFVFKYGSEDRWINRMMSVYDDEHGAALKCDNNTFGRNPHDDARKFCYQGALKNLELPSSTTTAKWQQVGIGSGCQGGSIDHEVSYGATRSEEWTTAEEWSQSVATSLSGAFMGLGPSIETTTAFAHSESYTKGLSTEVTRTTTFPCQCEPNTTSRIYQFQTSTKADCLSSQSCEANVIAVAQ